MSTTDTARDERLRGIQERAERATVAPWTAEEFNDYPGDEGTPIVGGGEVGSMEGHLVAYAMTYGTGPGGYDPERCDADAAFIAAARTDVPWLLAEVARLDAVVTAVREEHQPEAWEDDLEGTSGVACSTCVDGNREAITYPCPTVRALDGDAR